MEPQLKYNKLIQRIIYTKRREFILHLSADVSKWLAMTGIMFFLVLLIQIFWKVSSTGRYVLLLMMITIGLVSLSVVVLRLIIRYRKTSLYHVAEKIGLHFPAIQDRLKNALELYKFFQRNDENYSLGLVDEALSRVHQGSEDLDFNVIIDTRRTAKSIIRSFLICIILFAVILMFSTFFFKAAYAIFHPNYTIVEASPYRMDVFPGDVEVVKHDNVQLQVYVSGGEPPYIKLGTRNLVNGQESETEISETNDGHYEHTIWGIRDSTAYYFFTEDCRTDTYVISVIEHPFVRHLQLTLFPPPYTKLAAQVLEENVGDFEALKGTRVTFRLSANKTIYRADLVFDNADRRLNLNPSDDRAEGSMIVHRNHSYHIRLEDTQHRENIDPIRYHIKIAEDEYPKVKIALPGKDIDMDEEMKIKLIADMYDDFGISQARLVYQKINSQFEVHDTLQYEAIHLDAKNSRELRVEYDWNLTGLNLFPEDVVAYYIEVFDTDDISGPKSARSSTYRVRFPSADEIFAEVERGYDNTLESFEGMYQQSRDIKEKLEKIVQEMKRDPELNWEERKVLEEITEEQQSIQQTLQDLEKNVDDLIEKLETHDLISMEMMTKLQELQELMNEVMTDEMKNLLKKLQENFQSIDPKQLQQAMEKLDLNQQDLLKNLERNIEIMKRLQIEMKLDELVKKSEELLSDQMDLLSKAQESSPEDGETLSKQENDIERRAEDLKSEIAAVKEQMEQFPDMSTEKLDTALDHMEQSNMNQHMQQSAQNFQHGDLKRGMKSGELAEKALLELHTMLQAAKQELAQSQQKQVLDGLRDLSKDLLEVSMRQEDILNDSEGLGIADNTIPDVADRQQNLISGLKRVIETTNQLSNKTFFMSSSVANYIGLAYTNMQQSVQYFEERSLAAVNRNQKEAMFRLNDAVKELRKSINELNSSSSASGLEQMMQKLQQMSCQQQGINQSTLQIGASGQMLSLQQQASMDRLAAEQAAVKKSLEELEREYGNRADMLGRLDQLANEMADVVSDLKSNNISRKTIQRQREILSRLLDAQKSVRKREFSNKRQAETAKEYHVLDPGMLPTDLGEKNQQLRRDLLNLENEGYKKDFEELIKLYFEELFKDGEIN
ncbi:hypothetical protein JXB12_09200 [candidate division KSB1 bacterium]|nr:hypothetical protein [candidate division KSB1 bacterium]